MNKQIKGLALLLIAIVISENGNAINILVADALSYSIPFAGTLTLLFSLIGMVLIFRRDNNKQ